MERDKVRSMVVSGVVERGRQLGRKLGFPTANIEIGSVDVLRGVYYSQVRIGGRCYDAVTNVGVNPTVGAVAMRAESYIIGFEGDIYGETIDVELREYIRGEMRFDSIESLRRQISCDVEMVKEKFI